MRFGKALRPLLAILIPLALTMRPADLYADDETLNWWTAQRELTRMLIEDNAGIAKLATDLASTSPETGQEAIFKLCVMMRCGMNKQAIETLNQLHALVPELEFSDVSAIYRDACDNVRQWDVAKATVEIFADNISRKVGLENHLLKHFLESGWTVEQVDEWLAAMPTGKDNFWVKERFRFNEDHGRGDALEKELCDAVRRNPTDIDAAIALLEVLDHARNRDRKKWGLSWMAEEIEPELATQNEKIASLLDRLKSWSTAAVFYKRAIDTPLTERESKDLTMICTVFVSDETIHAMFEAKAREDLADCLLKLERNEEAQKWIEEAADIRKEHDLGLNALLSGAVQSASGHRVIEGQIRDKEKNSEDDPEYWSQRAAYYRGRKESVQEESALRRGLGLTTPHPGRKSKRQSGKDWRRRLLIDYAHFLKREKRTHHAVALLTKELEEAPASSRSAASAAHFLAFQLEKLVGVDQPALWDWLANRPTWESWEDRLLWRMLENANPDDLDKHFSRAEELAFGKDPTRAYALGWIMNRMRHPKRSIPLFKHAIENATDKHFQERATFALFESYLDTGNWRNAEKVFPEAVKCLTPGEQPEWYSRIAVKAARAGATTDAMRIWAKVANLSPCQLDGIEDLVDAGLRSELKDFYIEMRRKMPSSEVPAKALAALAKM